MAKGGDYERNVAKFLSKWLTGTTKPYMFWRQDASGGIATIHIENVHMTGDICSVHPDSAFFTDLFSIECKIGYPKTSFWQHFTKVKFGVQEFWQQALNDAIKSNKHPLLFYRKKGRKQIVGINRFIQEKLYKKIGGLRHIMVCWSHEINENPSQDCMLYDMETFFEKVTPDDIKGIQWQH